MQYDQASPRDLCPVIGERIAGVVDSTAQLNSAEKVHVESCLYCQAEVVRYRKLLRALHELRVQVVRPSPGLLAGILDEIGERAEKNAIRSLVDGRKVAYGGGIAVATLAGVAGLVLIADKHKRLGWRKCKHRVA